MKVKNLELPKPWKCKGDYIIAANGEYVPYKTSIGVRREMVKALNESVTPPPLNPPH